MQYPENSENRAPMILQQSSTFERRKDGDIDIQCSVCFFSGFSQCHCQQKQIASKNEGGSGSRRGSSTKESGTGVANSVLLQHPATISPYDNVPGLSPGKESSRCFIHRIGC